MDSHERDHREAAASYLVKILETEPEGHDMEESELFKALTDYAAKYLEHKYHSNWHAYMVLGLAKLATKSPSINELEDAGRTFRDERFKRLVPIAIPVKREPNPSPPPRRVKVEPSEPQSHRAPIPANIRPGNYLPFVVPRHRYTPPQTSVLPHKQYYLENKWRRQEAHEAQANPNGKRPADDAKQAEQAPAPKKRNAHITPKKHATQTATDAGRDGFSVETQGHITVRISDDTERTSMFNLKGSGWATVTVNVERKEDAAK
ncbi:hypothetical protein B0T20DRAFT_397828 [Sordaria brevicollis]|uniref:Uncharacterized protein n=1 Tax=Sordaria brevicollis TaxID=83679 RepID=A0AAE0U2K6_SORBR|nr:hypothetical protein B0T20DRAFT_397828 [Sordaria brevicollis]